jgi:DNA-binding GntR family transcriptional regulator
MDQATPPRFLIARPKLGEEVTRHLRDSIMGGEYSAGDRVRVEDLAGRLEVSAMPIREALTTLVSEGLLEALPRRGYRVAPVTLQDVEDVFAVHAFVAGILAERSARTIGESEVQQLEEMQRAVEQLSRQRSTAGQRAAQIEEVNFHFHRTINRLSPESSRLRWFLRAATRYVPRRFYQSIPRWTDVTINDHPHIIQALADHDAPLARHLMEAHIQRSGVMVVEHLRTAGHIS